MSNMKIYESSMPCGKSGAYCCFCYFSHFFIFVSFSVSVVSIFCYNILQAIICIYGRGMRSHDFIYLYIVYKIVIS